MKSSRSPARRRCPRRPIVRNPGAAAAISAKASVRPWPSRSSARSPPGWGAFWPAPLRTACASSGGLPHAEERTDTRLVLDRQQGIEDLSGRQAWIAEGEASLELDPQLLL